MFSVRNRHVWVRRPFHSRELACQGLVHHWLEDGSAFVTWVDESGVAFSERVDADRLVTVDASPNVGSMYG